MAFLDNVLNVLRRIVSNKARQSSLNYYVGGFNTAESLDRAMPVYPDAKLETFIEAYRRNASVYAIVNLAARKFSVVPRLLMEEEEEDQVNQYKRQIKSGAYKIKAQKKAYTEAV